MNRNYLHNGIIGGFFIIAFFSSISISITQIGLGIVLLCWTLLMLKEKKTIFTNSALTIPVLLYILALVISALGGINIMNSLLSIKDIWTCLVFFSMITFIKEEKIVKQLIYTLFAGAIIASVYGITQHLVGGLDLFRSEGEKIIQYAYLQVPNEVLAIGFFDHHLTFAEVILFSICLGIALLFWDGKVSNKGPNKIYSFGYLFILSLLSLVLGIAILFSYSRSSWIGFAIAFFFILIFRGGKISLMVGILFILLSVLTIMFHQPTKGRLISSFEQPKRLYIWKFGIDIFQEYPLTGVGLNNWTEVAYQKVDDLREKKIFVFGTDMGVVEHAHNNVLTRAAEEGIIGLSAFIYLFVVVYREGLRIFWSISEHETFKKGIVMGSLAGITAFHGAGLFENTFGDSEVLTLLWFVTALMFVLGQPRTPLVSSPTN